MPVKRELCKDDLLKLKTYLRGCREADPTTQAIILKPHILEALLNMAFKAVEGE